MNTLSTSDYKSVLFCIKYIPVIMFLIMFIHTGLLLMGINSGIADTIVGCAIIPSLLILSISKLLKFCWLLTSINMYDVYVAINSHYHNYCKLFKRWFMSDAEYKIIEAAMVYWFADEDCMAENKIVEHFK